MRWIATLGAAAVVVGSAAVLPAPQAQASPGGDVTTVVLADAIGSSKTHTIMCPAGSRALGGGVMPVAPPDGPYFRSWLSYSAPVDSSGNPASADTGDVPAGWTATAIRFSGTATDTWKWFATCSRSSDAVIYAVNPPAGSGVVARTAMCPSGTRVVGGGLAQSDPNKILGDDDIYPVTIKSMAPVDNTDSPVNTRDGDVAVGWQNVYEDGATFGSKTVAICSAGADATVVRSVTPQVDQTGKFGAATATCPSGTRAVSGGIGTTGPSANQRVDMVAPVSGPAEAAAVQTGAVPQSFYAEGKDDAFSAAPRYVFALCVTYEPPDTTPPDTTIGKGPKKKTTSAKAKVTFSSEPGATFTCQLDKQAAKPCTSPFKVKKLKPGKHKLTIIATDAAGNADGSPAVVKWKVLKKKAKPRPPHGGCVGECRVTRE
jgi:hypothetical protein